MSKSSLILGIIGTASGLIGAFTGIFALRQSKRNDDWIRNKGLIADRTELKKAVHSTHTLAGETLRIIRQAEGSRRSVMAAAGRSGAVDIMEQNAKRDTQAIKDIIEPLPAVTDEFEGLEPEQIAKLSAKVHAAADRISALKSHYEVELKQDEAQRDRYAQMYRPPT